MKPLTHVRLYSRDAMDPSTITPLGVVEIPTIGDASIILSRDEMGVIRIDVADVKPNPEFPATIDEATKTLTELHQKVGEMNIALQHALTDMFLVHKWLTR